MSTTPQNILDVYDLEVDFTADQQPVFAVKGVTLHVSAGEIVALVGESGSGKSVTAAAIMGLLPRNGIAQRGEVVFKGQRLETLSEVNMRGVRGKSMAMIFQNSLSVLDPSFTVGSQLDENIKRLNPIMRRAQRQRQVMTWLHKVGIRDTERVSKSYPHELSGGMRQRVMIALAIMCQPDLLIADEPTTALDSTIQKQILELLQQLNRELKMAILIITHDFGVVATLSHRVAVMQHGRIIETNFTESLIAAPRQPYTRALLNAVPELLSRPLARQDPFHCAEPWLQTRELSKDFTLTSGGGLFTPKKSFTAIHPLNLSLRQGEAVGIIGESGSGKSTLLRLLSRLTPASHGELYFEQQDISQLPDAGLNAFRRQVQCVFQDSLASFNPRLRLDSQLIRPLLRLKLAENYQQAREIATAAFIEVGLPPELLARFPHQLSGGQRQRASIARVLAVKPQYILLDEPTSALDVSVQAQIIQLLISLREKFSLTYFIVSHNLPVITTLCDRIIVMEQGKIVDDFVTGQLTMPGRHAITQSLITACLPVHKNHQAVINS